MLSPGDVGSMRSTDDLTRQAARHPDVFVASLRHHLERVVNRPIRTALAVVITYLMAVSFVAYAMQPDTVRSTLQSDPGVGELVGLLPPATYLAVLALAAIVGIPVGMVIQGVRRDLGSSHRRRQRRDG